ncbi:hypothetical protein [Nocardia implantans]|uniref:Uncharacterized protein n=1 Tax=Nocardia implantans TaxID=3108168 RepID=A0ABU6AX12_9NOCA|nr:MULTISPECIES: hypothetical protein [unclassified Nocardia]MBF6193812.1 hypothetical protein [Nocardia beijingensis]MEA3529452.1 hypothetical protein [Nocardia sp. CDC192]MEB3512038.1 hypothetical protein [Nocardia sp. CDC186]
MLIATLIITTVAMIRRRSARRSPRVNPAGHTAPGPVGRALRRPVPAAATVVALLGVVVAAGALAQC